MRRVFLVMAACCVLASPALAGGGVDLYGSYSQVVESENALGIGIRLNLGGTHWNVDIGVTGYQDVDAELVPNDPDNKDNVKYRAFDLGARYVFLDQTHKLRPYLGGGLSYAQTSGTNVNLNSGLGLYGMGGIRFGKTPGIQFMAELIYRWAEVQAKYSLVEERDVDFGGFGLQVGMSFVF